MPDHPDPARAQSPATAGGHVYLVEDEPSVRRSLALLLTLRGYATAEFGSAEEYLASAPRAVPACMLVDVRLPQMSGLELQARLAGLPHAPPVLLMTAHGGAALARAALLQGASDFLEKPIDERELLAAVESALAQDRRSVAEARDRAALIERLDALSAPERTLFDGITDGGPLRELAVRLGVAPAELDRRLGELMQKLGARRIADLLRMRLRIDGMPAGH